MSLFVDTSACYALLVRSEPHHASVARAFRQAVDRRRLLVTTNYVVIETCALLQNRVGLEVVHDFVTQLIPLFAVQWIDQPTHERAVARLIRTNRRAVSLVDTTSFTVMDAEGLTEALALDSDFETEGFRLVPKIA